MKELSATQWGVVSVLLDEALDLEPFERERWAVSLDQREPALAFSVRKLLAAHAACESAAFLPNVARPAERQPTADWTAGEQVGLYELKRELGRGGMATVWLAARTDPSAPAREVALKLPHPGWFPGLPERLGRERDILASLEHPHIARLYDAGLDQRGRPFLALEYVDGQPIDVFCRQRNASIDARIELLLQVADALAHAHSRLVVHRDLKPSNILVTAAGHVRLLDFGIAKLMQGDLAHETQLTSVVGRLLTLDYASPEQIRGEPIGTASDVYSLGVVAFELLAGGRPYQLPRTGAKQLEQAIATLDPPLASSAARDKHLVRELRGDLDAILNKALKQRPFDRYASIDAFAADLRRHRRGDTVDARPDSAWYRLRKLLARQKLASSLVGAVVLAAVGGAYAQVAVAITLAAGVGVSVWQARRAAVQAALARERARAAEREQQRAERVKETLLSLLVNSDADSGATASSTVRDLLCRAVDEVEALRELDVDGRVELQTVLGFSLESQGELGQGLALLGRTVALAKGALGADHPRTLEAGARYGALLFRADRTEEAHAVLEETVRRARATQAVVPLVWALQVLQSVLVAQGKRAEGLAAAAEAAEVATEFAAQVLPRDRVAAYFGHYNALRAARRPGMLAAADVALQAARTGYPDGKPPLPLLLHIELAHADALMAEGDAQRGLAEFERVLSAMVECYGPDHQAVGAAASWMGVGCRNFGSSHKAHAAFERAERVLAALLGPRAFTTGVVRMNVGSALLQLRRPALARAALRAGLDIMLGTVGAAHVESRRAADMLALACFYLGEVDEGKALLDQRVSDGLGTPLEAARWNNREGLQRVLTGDSAAARAAVTAATQALSASEDPPIERALEMFWAGRVAVDAADCVRGEALLREALGVLEQRQWSLSPDLAECRLALGRARALQGDRAAALSLWTSAVGAWLELDPGADYPVALARWLTDIEGMATPVETPPPSPQ